MAQLKLYYDLMSQPCRALQILVRKNKIPCQEIPVALRKGEHMEEEYSKINPLKRVPAIEHGGFRLSESVAIMRYLCREFPVPNHWYPKESQKQAKVDEFLEWQHLNVRRYGVMYFQGKVVQPLLIGKPPISEDSVKRIMEEFSISLNQIETIWLQENLFIAGNEVSIADLSACTELEQPVAAGCNITENRPKLKAYLERVKSTLHPHYDEAHSILHRLGKIYQKGGLDALRGK